MIKDLLMSGLSTPKNSAVIPDDNRLVLKCRSGVQMAFEICEKTHEVRLDVTDSVEYRFEENPDKMQLKEQIAAHMALAYFDF